MANAADLTREVINELAFIPCHSSEARQYIPFAFVSPQIIVNDAVQIISGAGLYHFGSMMSNVHMAWTRAACGRIKSDYRYSKDVVYNNLPWPAPPMLRKSKSNRLPRPSWMPAPSTRIVPLPTSTMRSPCPQSYGKPTRTMIAPSCRRMGLMCKTTETSCVAELMRMYQKLRS